MNVLRQLIPSRVSRSSSRSRQRDQPPTLAPVLTLHVPGYGAVRINAPSLQNDEPRQDYELNGELEVYVSQATGRRRCRSIKIGVLLDVKLDLGMGRMDEVDELFRTEVELGCPDEGSSSSGEGVWLEVGTQRWVTVES
jgi:hypothetical protein